MKTINKAYKLRLYPTKEQQILLNKHFGCIRFAYNYFLDIRNKEYKENKVNMSYVKTADELAKLKRVEGFEFLTEVNSQSLQWSLRYLDEAFRSFFKGKTKFPRFKSRRNKQSFKVPVNNSFSITDKKISIPKFLEGILYRGSIKLDDIIKYNSITISKTSTGKYYASVQCEVSYNPKKQTNKVVGIDLGLDSLLIDNEGNKYENIRLLKHNLKHLQYLQRQLSKKKKGSSKRNKARLQLAKQYENITNKKRDYLHKLTSKLINENQVICLETLTVKQMLNNHYLAQSIQDASWFTLQTMLKYKGEWNNRNVVQIDKYYPSSKSCSKCHFIVEELPLNIRQWECPNCNEIHDRDINAANNILQQGLNILSGLGTKSDTKQKPLESLSIDKAMKVEATSFRS